MNIGMNIGFSPRYVHYEFHCFKSVGSVKKVIIKKLCTGEMWLNREIFGTNRVGLRYQKYAIATG